MQGSPQYNPGFRHYIQKRRTKPLWAKYTLDFITVNFHNVKYIVYYSLLYMHDRERLRFRQVLDKCMSSRIRSNLISWIDSSQYFKIDKDKHADKTRCSHGRVKWAMRPWAQPHPVWAQVVSRTLPKPYRIPAKDCCKCPTPKTALLWSYLTLPYYQSFSLFSVRHKN